MQKVVTSMVIFLQLIPPPPKCTNQEISYEYKIFHSLNSFPSVRIMDFHLH